MYHFRLIPRMLPFQQKLIRRRDTVYLQALPRPIARGYTASKPSNDFCWTTWMDIFNTKIIGRIAITSNDVNELLERIGVNEVNDAVALKILEVTKIARFERTDYDVTTAVWKRLNKANVALKYEHYDFMLSYYAMRGNGAAAQHIYDDLIDSGFDGDVVARIKLFQAYCKSGDTAKATEFMKEFETGQVYISSATLNNFIQCHLINGDITGANRALEKLEAKCCSVDSYTLHELLCYHIRENAVDSVIDTFNQFKDNNFEYFNWRVLNAMLKLSACELSDYKRLIPFLVSNQELDRALVKLTPEFVRSGKAEVLPHIFEAINLKIDTHVRYMFTEMVRQNRAAAEYSYVWFQLERMNFYIRTNLAAYKPVLKSQSSALILEILQQLHSDPKETLNENCFKQLMKLAAEENTGKMSDVINLMCTTYSVRPRLGFITSIIIPLLRKKGLTYVQIVSWLRRTKIRLVDGIAACIQCTLSENDMKTACLIITTTKISVYLADETITIPLLNAYLATRDVDGFVRLLRLIVDSITVTNLYHLKRMSTQPTESDAIAEQQEFSAQMIRKTILAQRTNTPENLRLLQTLLRNGFSISSEKSRYLRKLLNVAEDSDIDKALKELCAKRSDHLQAMTEIV